jgi:hypothetical protein
MVSSRKSIGLTRLGHQVTYEDLHRSRLLNGVRNPGHQEIRQYACVEASRPEYEDIRRCNSFQDAREGRGVIGF